MPPSIIAPKVGILYLFKNVPKFTKIINITIVLIPLIYLILKSLFDTELIVEFTPIGFFKKPWTLFTFPFFQPDILSIIFLPLIHFISCKYFEPQWTSKELLFFWFFINASSALATSFVYSVAYTIKQKPEDYQEIVIKGLLPILAAFTVAYKQAIPEYKIKLFKNFIGFKLKQLPGLFLIIILIRSLILRSFQYLVISWFGIFISWVYLRFFKVQDSIRGDRSETFSFISFFPTIMRPPLKILSNSIYALLVKLRLCRPIHRISSLDLESGQFPSRAVFPSLSSPTSSTTPVESSSQDYDRRRAMALKALDERLKTSQLSPILESKSNADESN